jgi:hypothetical protein
VGTGLSGLVAFALTLGVEVGDLGESGYADYLLLVGLEVVRGS